ncbi:MAG: hypothetical protein FIB08_08995 [Candidatus Methanoperedens sp.]|nr:hypothetical protein [Candidatus Methanoperedens sp.]
MTTDVTENIRKMMGWCLSVNSWTYKPKQVLEFAHPPISPIKKGTNGQPFQSGNVIFSANGALLTLFSVIGFTLLFNLSRYLDYPVLLTGSIAMSTLCYILYIKTFQASICIDENGIHYNSFRLKNITLNYRDIISIKSFKRGSNKYSNKIWILIIVLILILGLSGIIFKEWKIIAAAVPILPVIFLLDREQKRRYHDLDTQVYIESGKNNWWFELSPYYSIITDNNTADRMRTSIEQYMKVIRQ